MLNAAKTLLSMELLLRFRRSQQWLYPLGFFLLVINLFPFAFSPDPQFLQKLLPGGVWIAALLASLLSVESLFFIDSEEGLLEQYLLSAYPFSVIINIKLCAQWITAELPLILLMPLVGWLFHLSSAVQLALCLSLLLGTPILTLMASLGAALSLGLTQGILLSLLILPLTLPVLIFGANIVQQAEAGFSILGPCAFLAGLSLIAIVFLPLTIAAVLRLSLDD